MSHLAYEELVQHSLFSKALKPVTQAIGGKATGVALQFMSAGFATPIAAKMYLEADSKEAAANRKALQLQAAEQAEIEKAENDRLGVAKRYFSSWTSMLDDKEKAGMAVGLARSKHERLKVRSKFTTWSGSFYDDLKEVSKLIEEQEQILADSPPVDFVGTNGSKESYEEELKRVALETQVYRNVMSSMGEIEIRLNGLDRRADDAERAENMRAVRARSGMSGLQEARSSGLWVIGIGAALLYGLSR